jgi:hypothetical protein
MLRWVELCRPEGWSHREFSKLICLDAIDIQQHELKLDMLSVYVSTVGQQLEAISGQAQG